MSEPLDPDKCPHCGGGMDAIDCYDEEQVAGKQYQKMVCDCGEQWTIVYKLTFEEITDRRHG